MLLFISSLNLLLLLGKGQGAQHKGVRSCFQVLCIRRHGLVSFTELCRKHHPVLRQGELPVRYTEDLRHAEDKILYEV